MQDGDLEIPRTKRVRKHVDALHCSIIANVVKTQAVNAPCEMDLALAVGQHNHDMQFCMKDCGYAPAWEPSRS
jgi:Uri superfamily endonuclease